MLNWAQNLKKLLKQKIYMMIKTKDFDCEEINEQ